jgi:hypothetical protein
MLLRILLTKVEWFVGTVLTKISVTVLLKKICFPSSVGKIKGKLETNVSSNVIILKQCCQYCWCWKKECKLWFVLKVLCSVVVACNSGVDQR